MTKPPVKTVAIIDPVGIKAGMDHYDLLLAGGLSTAGITVLLYSNFSRVTEAAVVKQFFFNTGVAKWKAIASNFFGTLRAFRNAKKRGARNIILHVFRAGIFDLVTFSIAKMMGLKLCTIVHDIESLDTFTLPFVRNRVLHHLPSVRVVHNDFCKEELVRQPGDKGKPVAVIPHVHFRHLFSKYNESPSSLQHLRENRELAGELSSELDNALQQELPVMLFFGQIKKAKGLEVYLEAIAQAKGDFVAVIAGKVRDDRWERYDDIITALNIRNKVIPIIRHITDQERDFLFAVSRSVILPYTHIYQSGVLLMAMSFPVAAIASDLLPNQYLIHHRINGLLFKSEHADDLARQMDVLIEEPDFAERLRLKGLMDIDALYNPKRIGQLFAEILG